MQKNYPQFLLKCSLLTTALAIGYSSLEAQTIKTIAGNMTTGNTGDGGPSTAALLNKPYGVAVDGAGNVYIADTKNARIRKVNTAGIISAFAGTSVLGGTGNGGPATAATFIGPYGIAADGLGNVYVADYSTNEIRTIGPTGTIFHAVGTGTACMGGDGGPATSGGVNRPWGLACDNSNNVYIADYSNNRIRKINAVSGTISTIAGIGPAGYTGDGGPATSAQLLNPTGVAVDPSGNVYIADMGNHVIRMINTAGIISTVVGTGASGDSNDGIMATDAKLNVPRDVGADAAGNIYVVEEATSRIRFVNHTTGIMTTVAGGNGWGLTGDGGPATAAKMGWPCSIALDAAGNMYVADYGNHTVRKIGAVPLPSTSVARLASIGDISVYPNPGNGSFNVAIPGTAKNVELMLMDIYGRVVAQRTLNNVTDINAQIGRNGLPAGTYMVRVIADDKSYCRKVAVTGE